MFSNLISYFLHTAPVDNVMKYLERVAAYDRYQASQGIEEAADIVADAAGLIGLSQVNVQRFPADGTMQWWSFKAPVSWTPITARLEVCKDEQTVLEIDHSRQPFSVATYSAQTPAAGVTLPLIDALSTDLTNLRNAVGVIGRDKFHLDALTSELTKAGVLGVVTNAACRHNCAAYEHAGRIELDPDSKLFAFSLTCSQFDIVRNAAMLGAQARVVIQIDRSATMPIVTGVIPGKRQEEVWMIAHLCHPRPGANDNASGVAALLGVAAAHLAWRRANPSWKSEQTIRFIWGPEFLATAAMLFNGMRSPEGTALPSAVIDLDMVGEDQTLCDSPFLVERSPDLRPSLINPLAERVVREVFAHTKAYPGIWRRNPFFGFSDHALFADPQVGRPAVLFWHPADRFNHSAGDSLDKVSPVEMLRSMTVSAVLAHILSNTGLLAPKQRKAILRNWCTQESEDAFRATEQYRRVEGGHWSRRLGLYTKQRIKSMVALFDSTETISRVAPTRRPITNSLEPVATPRWTGPFNTRAMLSDLSAVRRSEVLSLIDANKLNLSLLFNFAIRADSVRTRNQIIEETSMALSQPLEKDTSNDLFNSLLESGWVSEVSRKDTKNVDNQLQG